MANIKVIDAFVCNSLATLKAMEAEYNKYFLQTQAKQQRGAAVGSALDQFDQAIQASKENLAAVNQLIDEAAANLKSLQQPRKDGCGGKRLRGEPCAIMVQKARADSGIFCSLDALLLTKDDFVKAIKGAKDKEYKRQLIDDIIGLVTSVVTAGFIGAVAGRVDPFTVMMTIPSATSLIKTVANHGIDPVTGLSTGAPSQTRLQTIRVLDDDTNVESIFTIWTNWKQAYNVTSDTAKIAMSQQKMDEFMAPYLTLEAGEVYKYTMDA